VSPVIGRARYRSTASSPLYQPAAVDGNAAPGSP
jgi:hypothetical protein